MSRINMSQRLYLVVGFIAAAGVFSNGEVAVSATIYGAPADLTGSRVFSDPGLFVNDSDWEDILLEWEISDNNDGTFSYEYTISGLNQPGLSHLTLDISDDGVDDPDVVTNAMLNGNPVVTEIGDKDGIIGAVKFDDGADGTVIYSFTSNRFPVWGDVYGKAGAAGSPSEFYNTGFGDQTLMDPLEYIARPNGIVPDPNTIPEPGACVLLLSSIAMVAAARRRRA